MTWQGWIATLCLVSLIMASMYAHNLMSDNAVWQEYIRFMLDMIMLVAIFVLACKHKMDGMLKWRWGQDS